MFKSKTNQLHCAICCLFAMLAFAIVLCNSLLLYIRIADSSMKHDFSLCSDRSGPYWALLFGIPGIPLNSILHRLMSSFPTAQCEQRIFISATFFYYIFLAFLQKKVLKSLIILDSLIEILCSNAHHTVFYTQLTRILEISILYVLFVCCLYLQSLFHIKTFRDLVIDYEPSEDLDKVRCQPMFSCDLTLSCHPTLSCHLTVSCHPMLSCILLGEVTRK